jgi:hypothetical protein
MSFPSSFCSFAFAFALFAPALARADEGAPTRDGAYFRLTAAATSYLASFRYSGNDAASGAPLVAHEAQFGLGARLEIAGGFAIAPRTALTFEGSGGFLVGLARKGEVPYTDPNIALGGSALVGVDHFFQDRNLHVFGGVGAQVLQLAGSQLAVGAPDNIVDFELTAGPELAAGIGYVVPHTPFDLSAKLTGAYLRGAHTEYVPFTLSLGVGVLTF